MSEAVQGRIHVVVLVVAFNGIELLEDCLASVLAADDSGLDVRCVVLDNASTDGTANFVRERFPSLTLVESTENLGFAEGNNKALREAQQRFSEIDYVYLLNQDTIVDKTFLVEAVQYLESHDSAGAVQSLLLLHPETELINTAGNALHFLGFGLPTCYREPRDSAPASGPIGYPSGAAVLVRGNWIQAYGLFSSVLFMYLEDAELGWRLHLSGQPPLLCATSIVYHKYMFVPTLRSYGYLERNRLWLLLSHYRWRTLIVMLPMVFTMEVGQWMFALSQRLATQKIWAYFSFCSPKILRSVLQSRADVKRLRIVKDRVLLERMVGEFESPHLRGVMVTHVANPLLRTYLKFLRWLVVW